MPDGAGSATGDAAALAAATVTGNAGIPPSQTGNGDASKGSGAAAPADPFSGLDTGIREAVGKAGFKFDDPAKLVSDLWNKTASAESLIGKSVQVPGADAKPEDWDKFYGRIGRPEKADGYEFKLPDGLPEAMPYNGDFATAFKSEAAHPLGLTAKQAAGVHDWFVKQTAGTFTKQGEEFATKVEGATAAFEKQWGPKDSDKFKANIEDATRALKALKLDQSFKSAGLLSEFDGKTVVVDPAIGFALAEIGAKLYREDGMVQGNGPGAANNPFAEGPDKGNATAQNILWKSDPVKAATLIRAAGFTPEQFGYKSA